ncbi:unnamed protein product [Prunus armeniaca]
MSDPTVRSGPNLQDMCPRACRTSRNFRIGIWRLWAPQARPSDGCVMAGENVARPSVRSHASLD